MKHLLRHALVLSLAVLLLLCTGLNTASARSMKIFYDMDAYVEGEDLAIMWYNNVAGADHYDCTILNTTTGTYVRPRSTSSSGYDAYVSGSRMKAGYYKVWVGAVGADGLLLDEGIIYFTVNAASECDHRWSSRTGCCTKCDEECPHNSGVIEVVTGTNGTSISSTQHRIVTTYDEECRNCRYTVSEGKTRSAKSSHNFDENGDCENCDYRAACKHSTTKLVETSHSYSQYNDTYHTVKTVSNEVCANANCGKVIDYGVIDTYKAKHIMSNGSCINCYYAESYDPISVSISRNSSSAYTGSTIGASCSASGGTGKYNYYWYVYRDGAEIYSTSSWDTRGSYTASQEGKYTFKVLVEDRTTKEQKSATSGAITVTKAPCQHPNTRKVQDGDPSYTKISDSKHSIRTDWADVCTTCSDTVRTYYSTSEAAHTYSGGKCKFCGSAEPVQSCSHASMTSKELSRKYRASTSATQHFVDITWEDRCNNKSCNVILNTTRITTEKENHTFSGDVCTRCNYARVSSTGCDHASQKKTTLSSSTKPHDSDFHAIVTTYKVTCANASCGQVLNKSKTETTYERHSLRNNVCSACGYKVTCKHPNEQKKSHGDTYYEIGDAEYHFAITSYTISCKDCNATLDSSYTERIPFRHTMENGRCKHCGYQSVTTAPTPEPVITPVPATPTPRPAVTKAPATAAPRPAVTPNPAEPDCTTTGKHVYSSVVFAQAHPHQAQYATCACGAVDNNISSFILGYSLTCCQCGNHDFGAGERSGDLIYFRCSDCNYTVVLTAPADERMYDGFVEMDNALWNQDPFRVIGREAIFKLTEEGYVYISETIDATKDPGAAITEAVVDLFEDDYHTQQVRKWEYLIMQMLLRNPEYGYEGEARDLEAVYNAQNVAGAIDDGLGTYESMGEGALINTVDDWIVQYDGVITSLMQNRDALQQAVNAGTATQEQVNQLNNVTQQIDEMSDTRTQLAEASKAGEVLGKTAEYVDLAIKGFTVWDNTSQLYNGYRELAVLYDANMAKLESIIISAEAIGYDDVAIAARNVQATLTAQADMTLAQMNTMIALDTALEVGNDYAVDAVSGMLTEALEAAAPPLKIIGAVGSVADFALDWSDSYESAQTLMMLREMDNKLGMDVQRVLQNDPENGRFLAELYLVLQIEGLNQTKDFLQDYEKGRGLSVSEFNVHDLGAYLDRVDNHIDNRVRQNAALYTHYQQYQQEQNPNRYVVITSEAGRLRAGPDINSKYVFTAYKGATFEYLGRVDSWYKVLYNGEEAYVSITVSTLK